MHRVLTRTTLLTLLALPLTTRAAVAQDAIAAVIQHAERDRAAMNPAAALAKYESALATSPGSYELLWRASREGVDLGEAATTAARRTEYFAKAEAYARRAVSANNAGADGHFMLSVALGRTAQGLGARERVRYATEVRNEALAAVKLDATHAGALHVLGVWNAEIMRLGGLTRFGARTFLGAKVFDQASWPEAIRYLEAAVASDPGRITHRLDLAAVYADAGFKPKAKSTCEAVRQMPVVEFNDARYKTQCQQIIAKAS